MEVFNQFKLNYKIWFSDNSGKGVMGDGKWQILKAIDETGSLKGACDKLQITYRRTWNDLKQIERAIGFPLLESTRGGAEGGSMKLTSNGKKLISAFDHFHQKVDTLMQQYFHSMIEELNDN